MKKRSVWELVVLALVIAMTARNLHRSNVRNLAIGWHAGHQANPMPNTEEALADDDHQCRRMTTAGVKCGVNGPRTVCRVQPREAGSLNRHCPHT